MPYYNDIPGTSSYTKTSEVGTLRIALRDSATGLAMIAACEGVPPTTADIFQHGCIMTRTDSGTNASSTYENTGTISVPVWTLTGSNPASGDVTTVKVSLTSAQILALNGTPITLVAAPGAGKIVVPVTAQGRMNFLTAAYATNTQLNITYAAGADALMTNTTLLPVTAGAPIQPFFHLAQAGVTGNDNEYVANAALVITVPAGNPATGAGTLDVYLTYKIITL